MTDTRQMTAIEIARYRVCERIAQSHAATYLLPGYLRGELDDSAVIQEELAATEAAAIQAWNQRPEAQDLKAAREALQPFADCCDQIADDEDDEEWAKFRLLIKDYRRARKALA